MNHPQPEQVYRDFNTWAGGILPVSLSCQTDCGLGKHCLLRTSGTRLVLSIPQKSNRCLFRVETLQQLLQVEVDE